MIRISFAQRDGQYTGFVAEGHAGYAESGSDIVCAAVSAILATAAAGLRQVVHANPSEEQDDERGYLRVVVEESLPEKAQVQAQAILATARTGLLEIQRQYPDFVRIYSLRRR